MVLKLRCLYHILWGGVKNREFFRMLKSKNVMTCGKNFKNEYRKSW